MRVTAWSEPELLEVTHLGTIITGCGAFELTRSARTARASTGGRRSNRRSVALGEWGATTFVLPILRRIFTRSLTNLARLAEAEVAGDR